MAVRSRLLLPDITVRVADGEIDMVSRESLLQAMADAVILQEMAGGFISLAVQRVPTGAPNEMVTVSAMVEWKDRTDAKPQPEARATSAAEMQGLRDPSETALAEEERTAAMAQAWAESKMREAAEQDADPAPSPTLPFSHDSASPDGLDESQLQDEDVEAIPESVR